jgi:hypothetical protein
MPIASTEEIPEADETLGSPQFRRAVLAAAIGIVRDATGLPWTRLAELLGITTHTLLAKRKKQGAAAWNWRADEFLLERLAEIRSEYQLK